MIAVSNRVHMFARPESKEKLTEFLTIVLGYQLLTLSEIPGRTLSRPIIACRFENGSSLSVEFTEDALDEKQARRGAYLELQTDDPSALEKKILEAGLPRVEGFGNEYFYFQAPGGQVWRIAPLANH